MIAYHFDLQVEGSSYLIKLTKIPERTVRKETILLHFFQVYQLRLVEWKRIWQLGWRIIVWSAVFQNEVFESC
jgi:hypothetical protein